MKKLLKIFIVVLIAASCSNKSLTDLTVKDGLFYIKESGEIFSGDINQKYPSGQDSLIATILNGYFEGLALSFYENGDIKDSITYKNGQIIQQIKYTSKGQLVCDCNELDYDKRKDITSKNDELFDGTCEMYYDNNTTKLHREYSRGKKTGKWFSKYECGQIKDEDIFKNNEKIESRTYYKNGQLSLEWIKNKSKKEWYKSGHIKLHLSYNDKYIVEKKKWYKSGQIKLHLSYNDKYIDEKTGWHENGFISYKYNYDDINGKFKTLSKWNKNGELICKISDIPKTAITSRVRGLSGVLDNIAIYDERIQSEKGNYLFSFPLWELVCDSNIFCYPNGEIYVYKFNKNEMIEFTYPYATYPRIAMKTCYISMVVFDDKNNIKNIIFDDGISGLLESNDDVLLHSSLSLWLDSAIARYSDDLIKLFEYNKDAIVNFDKNILPKILELPKKYKQTKKSNITENKSDISDSENIKEPNDKELKNNDNSACDEFLTDYEEFMNDYIDIIKKYKDNPTDMSIMSDYTKMMQKAAEWTSSKPDCSDSEFIEKFTKIQTKIANAAAEI